MSGQNGKDGEGRPQVNRDRHSDFRDSHMYAGHPFAPDEALPEDFNHNNPHSHHHSLPLNVRSSVNPQLPGAQRAMGNANLAPVAGDHGVSFDARNAGDNALGTSQAGLVSNNLDGCPHAHTTNENSAGSTAAAPTKAGDEPLVPMPAVPLVPFSGNEWLPSTATSQQQTASKGPDAVTFRRTDAGALVPAGQPVTDGSREEPLSAGTLSTSNGDADGTHDVLAVPMPSASLTVGNLGDTADVANEMPVATDGSKNVDHDYDAGHASEVYHSEFDDESDDDDGDDEDRAKESLPCGPGGNIQTTQAGVKSHLLAHDACPSIAAGVVPQIFQDASCNFQPYAMDPGLLGGQLGLDSYTGVHDTFLTGGFNGLATPSSTFGSSPFSSMSPGDSASLSPLTRQSSANTVGSPSVLPGSSTGLTFQGGQDLAASLNTHQGQDFDIPGSAANSEQGFGQSSASSSVVDSSGFADVPGFGQNTGGLQPRYSNVIRTPQPTSLAYQSNTSALGFGPHTSNFTSPATYQQPAQLSSTRDTSVTLQHPQLATHSQPSPQNYLLSDPLDQLSWPAQSQHCDLGPQPHQNLQPVQNRQPPRNEPPAVHYNHAGAAIAPNRLYPHTPASHIFPPNTNLNQHTIPGQAKQRRSDTTNQDGRLKRPHSAVTGTFQQPQPQVPQQHLQLPQQLPPVHPQYILRSSPLIHPVPPHLILKSSPAASPAGPQNVTRKRPAEGTTGARHHQLQHPPSVPQALTEQDNAKRDDASERPGRKRRRGDPGSQQ